MTHDVTVSTAECGECQSIRLAWYKAMRFETDEVTRDHLACALRAQMEAKK